MDSNYYYSQMKELNGIMKESLEKKTSFFQHILIVSSSILGIIVSLHTNQTDSKNIRLIFILSVILLLLGTISIAIVLYDYSNLLERTRKLFHSEIERALKSNEEVKFVSVKLKRRTSIYEKSSYSLLIIALILLIIYNTLSTFN